MKEMKNTEKGVTRRASIYIKLSEWEYILNVKKQFDVSWRDILMVGAREIERLANITDEYFKRRTHV